MAERADAVVVGGGIVGASVAYLLAKEGLKVSILEQEAIGSGSTGHGHGVISLAGKDFRPGPHFALGLASARMYREFADGVMEDSGVDPLYHELEGISLAIIEEEERIFREFLARSDAREHVEMRWIDIDEARDLEPRLTENAIGGVLYRHGQIDGYRLTLAAVEAVERMGGHMLLRRAIGLRTSGGRVSGVFYDGGEIACDHVVLAGGAWTREAQEWIGFPIPVRPLHGEVLHVLLPGDPIRIFVLTARHGPILPRRDGVIMVGSIGGVSMTGLAVDTAHVFDPLDPTPVAFDGQPHEENRELMIGLATRVMPVLEDAQLVAHLAGVRPLSADRMPLIGPVPGIENVCLATGHGTKGIHLAPVTARIVTDLLVRGGTDVGAPLEPFLPERFAPIAA